MRTLRTRMVAMGFAFAAVLLVSSAIWAQDGLVAKLEPSGMIRVMTGEAELLMIELNAHGPDWKHAPQATATAQTTDLPDEAGKRVSGTLPVPNTDGGVLGFTETVKPLPQGLKLGYDVEITKTMKLNGLQVSICLPAARYAGKELAVSQPDSDEIEVATFPEEQKGENFGIWSGEGAKIEIAKGTPLAATLSLIAAADVVVQDLRKWERQTFEIRFPAIMEGEGREVTPDDRFHLDLTISFPVALKLQ